MEVAFYRRSTRNPRKTAERNVAFGRRTGILQSYAAVYYDVNVFDRSVHPARDYTERNAAGFRRRCRQITFDNDRYVFERAADASAEHTRADDSGFIIAYRLKIRINGGIRRVLAEIYGYGATVAVESSVEQGYRTELRCRKAYVARQVIIVCAAVGCRSENVSESVAATLTFSKLQFLE